MNRRGFLAALAGLGAAAVAGELLAPKRSIFLPPRGGWVFIAQRTHDEDLPGVLLIDDPLLLSLTPLRYQTPPGPPPEWLRPGPIRFYLPKDDPGIVLYNTSHPWKT